ncbi:hypothetical protein WR25_11457 [Diploscapter pachys]|uniref:CBS domain-containing protein n=1 Tax=Diploscapter pachys TaxID=2018661 RepID=A0A2A2J613_9BILA|nr:hypothetical protein WR25_11457 [Diploscapter pachys]
MKKSKHLLHPGFRMTSKKLPPLSPNPYKTYHGQTDSFRPSILEEPDGFARLLLFNSCYESMPTSSKMVVFDTDLVLWKAFNGFIYQNTRHVLLADSSKEGVISGILSVTDFIRVMLRLNKERESREAASGVQEEVKTIQTDAIGKMSIRDYRELVQTEGNFMDLVSINADQSLLEAARLLCHHRIHRLPVLDPDNSSPLFILTHKRILKFMWCFGQQFCPSEWRKKTAKELGVGTWVGIRVVFYDTRLSDCLDILLNKGVSGLPVVDPKTLEVQDVYTRFDAVGIALSQANCLDVTVEEALAYKRTIDRQTERIVSVKETDTLWHTVSVLVDSNVHRVCVVNEQNAIEGIISLSDVINFMVVKPGKALKPTKLTRHTQSAAGDLSDQAITALLQKNGKELEEEAAYKRNPTS